jgi:hypothetical protein
MLVNTRDPTSTTNFWDNRWTVTHLRLINDPANKTGPNDRNGFKSLAQIH